ncbi:UNVERIFIED_CONTAM: hypothetical protein Sindi_2939900 [Sesamum indicum]
MPPLVLEACHLSSRRTLIYHNSIPSHIFCSATYGSYRQLPTKRRGLNIHSSQPQGWLVPSTSCAIVPKHLNISAHPSPLEGSSNPHDEGWPFIHHSPQKVASRTPQRPQRLDHLLTCGSSAHMVAYLAIVALAVHPTHRHVPLSLREAKMNSEI